MAKPIIAGNGPANRRLLTHGHDAWLIPPTEAQALADAVRMLYSDPGLRSRLALNAQESYKTYASEAVITGQLHHVITESLHLPLGAQGTQ